MTPERFAFPASAKFFDDEAWFREAFADWFALEVMDTVFSEQGLPEGCARETRKSLDMHTYVYPSGYFDEYFSKRRVAACCKALMPKEASLTGQEAAYLRYACRESRIQGTVRQFPTLDRRPLSTRTDLQLETPRLDNHQFGLPFVAFLRDLARQTGERDLLVRALREFPLAPVRRTCRLRSEPTGPRWSIEVPPLTEFLAFVRAGRESAFDAAALRHGLKAGLDAHRALAVRERSRDHVDALALVAPGHACAAIRFFSESCFVDCEAP